MIKTKRVNELRGYTPYGARALHEFDVRDEFFGQSGIGIRFFILILPKAENGTMLDEKVLDEAVEVDNIIQKNLTIYNRITNKEESYNQVCRRFCTINDPVSLFAIGWKEQQENLRNGEPLNEKTRLNYPFSKVMDMNVNLQVKRDKYLLFFLKIHIRLGPGHRDVFGPFGLVRRNNPIGPSASQILNH
ncbi:unnamed protein product [Meloidogyne enterolobii]|uniref:Uncharacterized protein n=1 Tax=Meloidogyne enterolobii TaxID=390850 RepID=A0ACB0YRU9_MELEN